MADSVVASPEVRMSSESYDEVLYPGYSFQQSHPDRIATLATLFDMAPAPVAHCRVLELGCGDGANLIPVAFGLPGCSCLGLDLAERPIAKGQNLINALNLKNITLRSMNLLDVTRQLGEFDYIIAHGIYSWVPPAVQEKVLAICSENLAPHGVAYVSYNAYPGGHIRQMMRRMMLYHTRGIADPMRRVHEGIALIGSLLEASKEPDGLIALLKPEFERIQNISPEALFHDDFSDFYDPVYFYEFMERASRAGLKYLAEADLAAMHVTHASLIDGSPLPEDVDVVACEQILDFRVLRNFRSTLLCRAKARVRRAPLLDRIQSLYLAGYLVADGSEADYNDGKPQTFRKIDPKLKLKVTTTHPLTKAALMILSRRWPERVGFEDLRTAALSASGWMPPEGEKMPLETMMLKLYIGKIVDFHTHPTAAVAKVSERPIASPLARCLLAGQGRVVNLNHVNMHLDGALSALIQLLDGSRDHAALLREMTEKMRPEAGANSENTAAETPQSIEDGLEENLKKIAGMALLTG